MMEDRTEKIIEAVLERIAQQQNQNADRKIEEKSPTDHILVLYGESRWDVREGIRQIRILMERGYAVSHLYTPQMLKNMMHWKKAGRIDWYPSPTYTEEDEFQSMEILDQTDLVILPTWSVGFLTRLLEGYEDNLAQLLLQEILCREIPLLMTEGYESTVYKNSEFYQTHLAKKVDEMKKYGAKMLPVKNLSGYILSGDYQIAAGSKITKDVFSDSVFCSADLKKAKEKQIIVDERTIISQEAMDQAKERGIQIIKVTGRKSNV